LRKQNEWTKPPMAEFSNDKHAHPRDNDVVLITITKR
jgi:hypothetical protein